jgi:hypothetical protein
MELRICPGINKLYRLALVEGDDSFTTLSEHDTPAQAVMAKFRAEVAADLAELRLAHIAKARAA